MSSAPKLCAAEGRAISAFGTKKKHHATPEGAQVIAFNFHRVATCAGSVALWDAPSIIILPCDGAINRPQQIIQGLKHVQVPPLPTAAGNLTTQGLEKQGEVTKVFIDALTDNGMPITRGEYSILLRWLVFMSG